VISVYKETEGEIQTVESLKTWTNEDPT
jgi:hypothetical protein